MSISLYDVTVPAFLRAFDSLQAVLDKGEAFAKEKGIDPEAMLGMRLYDDMAPLSAQIQRASDTSKACIVRVAGIDNVPMADEEKSFADLRERIVKTVAVIRSVTPEQFAGKEEMVLEVRAGSGPVQYLARDYVTGFVLPNFYFHITTAYDLLRHQGVAIGKKDYLGKLPILA